LPALVASVVFALIVIAVAWAAQSAGLFILGLALSFVIFMFAYLPWSREEIGLQGQCLAVRRGVLRRQTCLFPLRDVDTIETNQSVVGHFLDYADVTIRSGLRNETICALGHVRDFMSRYNAAAIVLTQPWLAPRLAPGLGIGYPVLGEPSALREAKQAEPSPEVVEGRARTIAHDVGPPPSTAKSTPMDLETRLLQALFLISFLLFFIVLWWMIHTFGI